MLRIIDIYIVICYFKLKLTLAVTNSDKTEFVTVFIYLNSIFYEFIKMFYNSNSKMYYKN
jgi:hypothetical protein